MKKLHIYSFKTAQQFTNIKV